MLQFLSIRASLTTASTFRYEDTGGYDLAGTVQKDVGCCADEHGAAYECVRPTAAFGPRLLGGPVRWQQGDEYTF